MATLSSDAGEGALRAWKRVKDGGTLLAVLEPFGGRKAEGQMKWGGSSMLRD
jgi:hypothetical protein